MSARELAPPPGVGRQQPRWRRMMRSDGAAIGFLFVLPYVVLFLIFRIGPTIAGFLLSFTEYGITGTVEFIGLDNFTRLFADDLFWTALWVTVVYTVLSVPLVMIVSLAMALLSNRTLRGIAVYRTMFFLPVVTSFVISGIVWLWLYAEDGPLNWMFGLIGVGPVPWLQSEALVLPSLSLLTVWARFGYDMLILLAGLLAIPPDYHEAAAVDGASAWQRFRHITLPLLRPALFFVLVLELIHSFQVFDTIYVMTAGGPVRASYSLVFLIYDQGFRYFDFGYASAAGVVLFVITLVVSLVQRRLLGREK